jgi:hypothetical protein
MAKRRRSPVFLKCERLLPDDPHDHEKLCRWECDDAQVAGVELVDRHDPTYSAILHRSSKPDRGKYPWQLSFFDSKGAVSDTRGASCARLLNDATPHYSWKLRTVQRRR